MRLAAFLILASAGPAAAQDPLEAAQDRRAELVARVAPAVVAVMPLAGRGGGSGVLIDPDGSILTNHHVVAGTLAAREPKARAFLKCGTPDGKLRLARIVGLDPGGDLALIRLERAEAEDPGPFPCRPLGGQDGLKVGDGVLAMGNPFLLATDFAPTVTFGIVSGLRRFQPGRGGSLVYPDCVQTDASLNPGNSGGPLFDLAGRVAGINGRIAVGERGRVNVGVGFAVSADLARLFLPDLRAGKVCAHGSLRLDARELDGELVVAAVEEEGPAWRAGIRSGDRLLALDGQDLRGQNDLLRRIAMLPAGWPVELCWRRAAGGQAEESWLRLAAAAPADPKLQEWEPEDLDGIVRGETRRLAAMAAKAMGSRPGGASPPLGRRLLAGEPPPVPAGIHPAEGILWPPFPEGAEYEGGERVAGRPAAAILLPGGQGERLFLDPETGMPLGTAFSPAPAAEEIRILVASWREGPAGRAPARVIWRQGGRTLAEEELVPGEGGER